MQVSGAHSKAEAERRRNSHALVEAKQQLADAAAKLRVSSAASQLINIKSMLVAAVQHSMTMLPDWIPRLQGHDVYASAVH